MSEKTWNHYTCQACGTITVAKHADEGVTPFMISCTCGGPAQSGMYRGSQSDDQTADIIWFCPSTEVEFAPILAKFPKRVRSAVRNHWALGGALMRDAAGALIIGRRG